MTKIADADLCRLLEAALIDMARERAEAMVPLGFNYSDEQVFDLVELAMDEIDIVAVAAVAEKRVLIIKEARLLRVVGDPRAKDRSVMVIPCADAGQVVRAALAYGDETVRRGIFGGVRH
jgi:hypothetical protein